MTFFPTTEFQRVSNRPITKPGNVVRFRSTLDPLREAMGFPIGLTSFIRAGDDGTHGREEGLDFQPAGYGNAATRLLAGTEKEFQRKLERMFSWLEQHPQRRELYGKIIHERNHVHMTTPGSQGAFGEVWREPTEGVYVQIERHKYALGAVALVCIGLWMLGRSGA